MSPAKACVPARRNRARQLGFLRQRLGKEPGRQEAPVPTHGSTPCVPSSPDASNSRPLLLHHARCKHIVLLQRGKPDSGHGKRQKNTYFNTTLPRFLLHTPPARGQPPPCGKPKGCLCPGMGEWKQQHTDPPSHNTAILHISAAMSAPTPL